MKKRKQQPSRLGLAIGLLLIGGCVFLSACQSGLEVKVERYEGDLILEERMQFARIQAVGREATDTLIRHFEVAATQARPPQEGEIIAPPALPSGPYAEELDDKWEKLKERVEEYVYFLVHDLEKRHQQHKTAEIEKVVDTAESALAEIGSVTNLHSTFWSKTRWVDNLPRGESPWDNLSEARSQFADAIESLQRAVDAASEVPLKAGAVTSGLERAEILTTQAVAKYEVAKDWLDSSDAGGTDRNAALDLATAYLESTLTATLATITKVKGKQPRTNDEVRAALDSAEVTNRNFATVMQRIEEVGNTEGFEAVKLEIRDFRAGSNDAAERWDTARTNYLEVRRQYSLDRGISKRHDFNTLSEDIWRVLHWAITYRLWANTGNSYRQMTQDSFLRFAAQFGAEVRASIRRSTRSRAVILTDIDRGWLFSENGTVTKRIKLVRDAEASRAAIERKLFEGSVSSSDVADQLAILDRIIYSSGSDSGTVVLEKYSGISSLRENGVTLSNVSGSSSTNPNRSLDLVRKWLHNSAVETQYSTNKEKTESYEREIERKGGDEDSQVSRSMSVDEVVAAIRMLVEHSALFKPETSNSLNNEMLMTGMGHFAEQLNSLRASVEHTEPKLAAFAEKFKRYVEGLQEQEQRRSVWSEADSVNRYGRPVFNPNGSQYHELLYEVWRVSAGNYQRISSLANFILRGDRLKHHVPGDLPAEIDKHQQKYRRGAASRQRKYRNEQWDRILETEQMVANAIRDGIMTESGRPQTIKELGEPELEILRAAVRSLYHESLARHTVKVDSDVEGAEKKMFDALFTSDLGELSRRLRDAEASDLLSTATLTDLAAKDIRNELRKATPNIVGTLQTATSWTLAAGGNPASPTFDQGKVTALIGELQGKDVGILYKPKDGNTALADIFGAGGLFWPSVPDTFTTPSAFWDFSSVKDEEAEILIKPLREAALAYLKDKTALRTKILPAWVDLLLPAYSEATPVASASVRLITAWQGEDVSALRESLVPLWDIHGASADVVSGARLNEIVKRVVRLWAVDGDKAVEFAQSVTLALNLPVVAGVSDDTGLKLFQNATASLVKKSKDLIFNMQLLRDAQEALEFLRNLESSYIGVRSLGDYLSLDTAAAEAYGMSYDPWHTITTVFVKASTNADYVVMRDMNGNWQVKATKNDPTELINFIYGAALAAIEIATNAASGGSTGMSSGLTEALTKHGQSLIENAKAGRINTWAMQEVVDAYAEYYKEQTDAIDKNINALNKELDGDDSITNEQIEKTSDTDEKLNLKNNQTGLIERASKASGNEKKALDDQIETKRKDLVAALKVRQAIEQEYDRLLSNMQNALLSSGTSGSAAPPAPSGSDAAKPDTSSLPYGKTSSFTK